MWLDFPVPELGWLWRLSSLQPQFCAASHLVAEITPRLPPSCAPASQEAIGVELTENLAMLPAASVSGLYFGGKCSKYFSVGKIAADQVKEYAGRTGQGQEETEKWLRQMLAYEP